MRIGNRLSFSDWPPKINTSKTRAAGLVSWPCLCFVSAHNHFSISDLHTSMHSSPHHAALPPVSQKNNPLPPKKEKPEKSADLKAASSHLPPDWRHRSSLPGRLCPADSCLFKKPPKTQKRWKLKHKWWKPLCSICLITQDQKLHICSILLLSLHKWRKRTKQEAREVQNVKSINTTLHKTVLVAFSGYCKAPYVNLNCDCAPSQRTRGHYAGGHACFSERRWDHRLFCRMMLQLSLTADLSDNCMI